MLKVLGILGVSAAMVLIEGPALLKKGLKKEMFAFSILLLIGAGMSIGNALQLNVPNPLAGLVVLFKPFSDFIFRLLK